MRKEDKIINKLIEQITRNKDVKIIKFPRINLNFEYIAEQLRNKLNKTVTMEYRENEILMYIIP